MTNEHDQWTYERANEALQHTRYDMVGPAGRPKPLPIQDLSMVPGKGNLGGPGNWAANGGIGAEEPREE